MAGRASVIGLGVIGGSLSLALKKAGWYVSGSDRDVDHLKSALKQDVIDEIVDFVDSEADVVFVATPPSSVAAIVKEVLAETSCPVTDVASVKSPIVRDCVSPLFVPGHPMSGSERSRLEGASVSLFEGATWILTPTENTDEVALSYIAAIVQSLKAELRLMDPKQHDQLVAAASHLPHLSATALLTSAFGVAEGHEEVLARVAAGGFRDMTRVASSDRDMWLDICHQNREAIVTVLDVFIQRLSELRKLIDKGEEGVMRSALDTAFANAKRNRESLPRQSRRLVELVIPLGFGRSMREVLKVSTTLDVSVRDHFVEKGKGLDVMHVSVPEDQADLLRGGLRASGLKAQLAAGLKN